MSIHEQTYKEMEIVCLYMSKPIKKWRLYVYTWANLDMSKPIKKWRLYVFLYRFAIPIGQLYVYT